MCAGFTLMIFIDDVELLIWIAWPCIGVGAICNHIPNVKMTLAIPTVKGIAMSSLAGAFGAGSAVMLIMKGIMDQYNLRIPDMFLYWLIAYIILATIKIIVWTPKHMPSVIVHDDEFSIYDNSEIVLRFRG